MRKQLSGWSRLWLVFSIPWFIVFLLRSFKLFNDLESDRTLSRMIMDHVSRSSEITHQLTMSIIIAFVGPLFVYFIFMIIVWVRNGFTSERKFISNISDSEIITGRDIISEPTKNSDNASIKINSDGAIWPRWDWSDWLNLLLIGYIGHILSTISLALVFRINTSPYDPLSSIAYHLPLFILFYVVKMAIVRTKKIQPSNKHKSIVAACYLFTSFLFTAIPSAHAAIQQ